MLIFFTNENLKFSINSLVACGLGGYKNNTAFSDADFGYSLLNSHIGIFSGLLSLADYLGSIEPNARPKSVLSLNTKSSLFLIDNKIFIEDVISQTPDSLTNTRNIGINLITNNIFFLSYLDSIKRSLSKNEAEFFHQFDKTNSINPNNKYSEIDGNFHISINDFFRIIFYIKKLIGEAIIFKTENNLDIQDFSVGKLASFYFDNYAQNNLGYLQIIHKKNNASRQST